jgi:hypothetical protein
MSARSFGPMVDRWLMPHENRRSASTCKLRCDNVWMSGEASQPSQEVAKALLLDVVPRFIGEAFDRAAELSVLFEQAGGLPHVLLLFGLVPKKD